MLLRIRLLSLLAAALAVLAPLEAANLDGSSRAVGDAEASRLYAEANAYVKNMAEGQYSYAYLQFYWKRAQANVDRIRHVYAESPTAVAMNRGELTLGGYELSYFKERVLYNLELKQLGSFDDVNCAIFLYGLDESRSDSLRDQALADILEVLARRQRWGEALRFPVLDIHKPLLLSTIFRVAAFYDQPEIMKKMIKDYTPQEREAAGFEGLQVKAMALLGKKREDLFAFVASHPSPFVRRAALEGIVERAILQHRMEGHHLPDGNAIQTTHTVVQNLSLHDDVHALALRLYPTDREDASPLLEVYDASNGIHPDAAASAEAHLAFQRYLADAGKLEDAVAYARGSGLPGATRRACELKSIELLAEAGRTEESGKLRARVSEGGTADANQAALAEFTGRVDSREVQLVARTKTFSELPISDPCVMAKAIMDWSLAPNRSQRGATPWDAVVFKFAGGFKDLPKPKSEAVSDAASTVRPY